MTNRQAWFMTVLAFAFFFVGHVFAAQELGPKSYSATEVSSVNGKIGRTKVYKLGEKMRLEPQVKGRGGQSYTVVDLKTHKNYMVMGGGKMCIEMRSQPSQAQRLAAAKAAKDYKSADKGIETISVAKTKYRCRHRLITWTDKKGKPYKMDVWSALSLHEFPVKEVIMSKGKPFTMTYEDISLSAPDPKLFVMPGNCRSMGGMMGRLMGGFHHP